MNDELLNALIEADLARAEELLSRGAEINARDEVGNSALGHVITYIVDASRRREVVEFMLAHGADPSRLSEDQSGPLIAAIVESAFDILPLLLDHGADPNREFDLGETAYEVAEFDYRVEAFDMSLPESPAEADLATEDAWLRFLDRLAIRYGKHRPDHLFLLREHGALRSRELAARG